ncbi:hypothetical protein NL676_039265 [Syzygium grande]|nr:hypothetical protein NL676_039265 [Syzygium grande]
MSDERPSKLLHLIGKPPPSSFLHQQSAIKLPNVHSKPKIRFSLFCRLSNEHFTETIIHRASSRSRDLV